MHTLILGKQSAVIFLEQEEAELARRFTGRQTAGRELRSFLRRAGLDTAGKQLYLELFENEGRCLLFVSPAGTAGAAGEAEPECRVFRFRSVDDLMDAIAALPCLKEQEAAQAEPPVGPSRLYGSKTSYYLVLYPPFAVNTAYLIEFGEELERPEPMVSYLAEHGALLSGPDALSLLARHFS